MTEKYAVLNQGEDNEMELFGYREEKWRQMLCIIGYICSFGFLWLLFYWKPEVDVWCQCVPCSFEEADVVLLRTTGELKQYFKKKVRVIYPQIPGTTPGLQINHDKNSIRNKSIMKNEGWVRFIKVQKIRYVWNASEDKFQRIGILEDDLSCSDIHSKFGSGLTKEEQELRRQICGLNTIEVKITPIWKLLFKEIFNPFYVFQAYSISLWIFFSYLEYSMAILVMTFVSVSATIYNLRVQSVKLHKMSKSYNSIKVTVLHKNGELEEVESQSLVPGDVIILSGNKLFLPCDAILISGVCTVNEGMLTGESIPVTKTQLPNIDNSIPWKAYSGEDYKKHVLFCGTEVIQTKMHGQNLVKAVVLQTGFNTAKGDLVRAILYNKPMNVKLHKEALRFLLGLVSLAVFGVIYTVVVYNRSGASVHDTVLMSLLMLTIAVNAALPASLTLGLLYAQTRLKKVGIFCISPQRINLAGQLNLICFDKTGTLTEDVLDLHGIVPCEGNCFQDVHYFFSGNTLPWGPLLGSMASCHSLITLDGKLHGDPLDLKMFEGTGWELKDFKAEGIENGESMSCTMVKPGPTSDKGSVEGITILQQFPFSSTLQRMSVITQVIGGDEFTVFLKGAPEKVINFCKPETVPQNFSKTLDFYTTQGFRVIGLAYRILPEGLLNTKQLEREAVECDLIFLGLLIMENRLKPETNSVLHELSAAKIRNVMITGDNLQTALTIGSNSGMIPKTSKLILIEAMEPEGDVPATISWKTMTEYQENGHQSKESQIDINGGWIDHNTSGTGAFHFAMSGKSFLVILHHFYNLLPKILLNGTIFARMTPWQKSSLIEEFQKLDYYVGMCGDGANDCGALKKAHVGISLSELEASVASPFTSKIPNVECVPLLIKEGRNVLVTSFSIFKFLTMTTVIGLTAIVFLFWKQTLFSNYQYLLQDFSIVILVSIIMSLNGPAPELAPYRPPGQVLSPPLLLSLFVHLILTIIVQATAYFLLVQQPWYNERDVFSACLPLNHTFQNVTVRVPTFSQNYITTTLWPVSSFNLIIVEFVFAKGRPFRQRLYTNYSMCIVIALQVTTFLFFLFMDIEDLYNIMEIVCIPYYWRIYLLIMLLVLFVASYTLEEGFIENRKLWSSIKRICNHQSKSQYRKLQKILEKDPDWPPQNRTDYASKSASVIDSKVVVFSNPAYRPPKLETREINHVKTNVVTSSL